MAGMSFLIIVMMAVIQLITLEAERTVRPVTRARKSSLHHSSEDGLQMALAYMIIIGTAKRLGHEIKDFIVRAWRDAIYGNNDLKALLLPVIATKKKLKLS